MPKRRHRKARAHVAHHAFNHAYSRLLRTLSEIHFSAEDSLVAIALICGVGLTAWVNDGPVRLSSYVFSETTTMRLALVASILLLASCAERPSVGITISNTPAPIGACAPPKPARAARRRR